MAKKFKIGDHVNWNSEAGRVSGTIMPSIPWTLVTRAMFITLQKMTLNTKSKAIRQITSRSIKAAPSTTCDEDAA
jgi:hypothetical protein